MKIHKLIIEIFILFILLLSSCESDILDKEPVDRFSEAALWKDIKLTDLYLQNIYGNTGIGFRGNETLAMTLTDDGFNRVGRGTEFFVQGTITPSTASPFDIAQYKMNNLVWNNNFVQINKINIFLANIDKVLDAAKESEKAALEEKVNIQKGEAFFLRALTYHNLVRVFGGVPLFSKPNLQDDDFLSVQRASFKEIIDFIVEDCNAAAELLLEEDGMQMGRANKGAALALKSRILLFAASDLTADNAANKYVGYENPNRKELWTAAKNAAKEVIDLNTYSLEDWGNDPSGIAEGYMNLFRLKDYGQSSELIWGRLFTDPDQWHKVMWMVGQNGAYNVAINTPTQNLVDAYQMADGSDFWEHFELDEDKYYINKSSKFLNNNPYHNRDPRFTGTILYDSAKFQPRITEELRERDPLGMYERRDRVFIENGKEVKRIYAIDGPNGPIYWTEASWTGYCCLKFQDPDVISVEVQNQLDYEYVELRYAEVLLNYAEACLELGEMEEAGKYINMIRNRADMPDFTGDIKKALRYERRIELALEESRFFDIRRWKILDEALVDVTGIRIIETHEDGNIKTTWQQIHVQNRGPVTEKLYWIPIHQNEIDRAPQLIQNPGY